MSLGLLLLGIRTKVVEGKVRWGIGDGRKQAQLEISGDEDDRRYSNWGRPSLVGCASAGYQYNIS
jgi:hypothetical protein